MSAPETIAKVAELMVKAKRAAVLTGAGVSAESGVPTFRGKHGFWKDEEVMKLATLQGFLSDPKKAWEWYDWRRGQLKEVEPNPGHHALAEWEKTIGERGGSYSLITQNIDGLHEHAGSESILELHGNIWYARCLKGCTTELKHIPETPLPEYPPPCPWCDSILRPHVVWFGEQLDPAVIEESFAVSGAADLMLVVGTSAQVYPAAGLPYVASRAGGKIVEINLEPTELTHAADFALHGRSGEILPELMDKARELSG